MKIKLAGNKDRKQLIHDLDEAWSLYVKLSCGLRCSFSSVAVTDGGKCGKRSELYMNKKEQWKVPVGLQAAHIIRRQNFRYRWDLSNGIALCTGHHLLFDGLWRDNGRSEELLINLDILAQDELRMMKFLSRQPAKVDVKLQMLKMIQDWETLSEKDDDCRKIHKQLVDENILSLNIHSIK